MIATPFEPRAIERPKPERLRLAIEDFYARSTRRGHPEGEWQDGLWYPSESERRTCCESIQPSAANRQALESHCRSQVHVAALYGLAVGEVKAAVRDDRKRGSPIAQYVVSSFVGPRPRGGGAETFAELRRRARGEAFETLRMALAHSLPLFERLNGLEGAEDPDEEVLAPLLGKATVSAERLLASLTFARSLESSMAFTNALLETLKAIVEEPRPKRRRAPSLTSA